MSYIITKVVKCTPHSSNSKESQAHTYTQRLMIANMYTGSNDTTGSKRNGLGHIHTCEQHEKEFFGLFDFATAEHSSSSIADDTGSPLKAIQGAASAVFGGIWSALDTAIAILNEDVDMENSTEDIICSVSGDGNQNIVEYDVCSDSVEHFTKKKTADFKSAPTIAINSSKGDNATLGMLSQYIDSWFLRFVFF